VLQCKSPWEDEIINLLFINVNQRAHHSSPSAIPLSMGYIVAYLRSLGHEGVILDDLHDRPLSLQTLETWIQKLSPEVVGFSAYQANMERIRFFSFYIKSRHPNIRVLLGGPQAISMPSSALLELAQVDIICRGEGEIVASAIAECIEKNNSLSSVNAITFRDHNSIIDTVLGSDFPEELDQFPSPYLAGTVDLQGKDGPMISTARGCKYNCLFCVTPATSGRRVRCHSVKRTLDEMEYLADKGMKVYLVEREPTIGGHMAKLNKTYPTDDCSI
jgi:anaerobic magnesium-protoporphyrin IX monomethyl ester cyclase